MTTKADEVMDTLRGIEFVCHCGVEFSMVRGFADWITCSCGVRWTRWCIDIDGSRYLGVEWRSSRE